MTQMIASVAATPATFTQSVQSAAGTKYVAVNGPVVHVANVTPNGTYQYAANPGAVHQSAVTKAGGTQSVAVSGGHYHQHHDVGYLPLVDASSHVVGHQLPYSDLWFSSSHFNKFWKTDYSVSVNSSGGCGGVHGGSHQHYETFFGGFGAVHGSWGGPVEISVTPIDLAFLEHYLAVNYGVGFSSGFHVSVAGNHNHQHHHHHHHQHHESHFAHGSSNEYFGSSHLNDIVDGFGAISIGIHAGAKGGTVVKSSGVSHHEGGSVYGPQVHHDERAFEAHSYGAGASESHLVSNHLDHFAAAPSVGGYVRQARHADDAVVVSKAGSVVAAKKYLVHSDVASGHGIRDLHHESGFAVSSHGVGAHGAHGAQSGHSVTDYVAAPGHIYSHQSQSNTQVSHGGAHGASHRHDGHTSTAHHETPFMKSHEESSLDVSSATYADQHGVYETYSYHQTHHYEHTSTFI